MNLITLAKWGAASIPVLLVIGSVVMFFLYRSDYIRLGVEEPTLLAFRLTLSSLRGFARFRRGEKPAHHHARRGDPAPHDHVRATDMGTINRPLTGAERRRLNDRD